MNERFLASVYFLPFAWVSEVYLYKVGARRLKWLELTSMEFVMLQIDGWETIDPEHTAYMFVLATH